MGEGIWNRQANPVELLEVWGTNSPGAGGSRHVLLSSRDVMDAPTGVFPRNWGEAGLVLRHSRAASHSCCLKRVEGGRINVQGENSGCGVFPVILGLRFLFILSGSGSTLLFLAADLTLQAVWRWSSSRGAGGWQRSISVLWS